MVIGLAGFHLFRLVREVRRQRGNLLICLLVLLFQAAYRLFERFKRVLQFFHLPVLFGLARL